MSSDNAPSRNSGRGRGRGRGRRSNARGRGRGASSEGGSGINPHDTGPVSSESSRGGSAPRGGFRGNSRGRGRGGSRNRRGAGDVGGGPRVVDKGIFNEGVPAVVPSHLSNDKLSSLIQSYTTFPHSDRPLRPDFGTKGAASLVRANFFAVQHEGSIFDYVVTITPTNSTQESSSSTPKSVPNAKKKRLFELLEELFEQDSSLAWCLPHIAHDYAQRMVSSQELPQPLEVTITYRDEGEEEPRPNADVYLISIKFERELESEDSKSYLEGRPDKRDFDIQPYVSAINLFLQQFAGRTGVRVGKNRYFFQSMTESRSFELNIGLEAWKGFSISTRPSYGQLLVNIHVCWAAFVRPGNLAQRLQEFRDSSEGGMPSRMVNSIKVKLTHLGYTKRLFSIGSKAPRNIKFQCEEFGEISVEEYFKKRYDRELKHPDLPVVNVGNRAKAIWVPPELCEILPGCAYRGKLDEYETSMMIRHACNPPKTNFESIVDDGLPTLGFKRDEDTSDSLEGFGLSVDLDPIVIPSRELPPPRISYQGSTPQIQNGGWNIVNAKFHRSATVNSWSVLVVQDSRNPFIAGLEDQKLTVIVDGFKEKCASTGMTMPEAAPRTEIVQLLPLKGDEGRSNSIEILRRKLGEQLSTGDRPDFVLVLLEKTDRFIYPALKCIGDVKLGIHTVIMQARTVMRGKRDQYFSNVALKVNAKLGGVNHRLDDGAMTWLTKKKTMLVGIDVTHRSPGSQEGTPSIAAMVANVDDSFVQFPASIKLQTSERGERPNEMVDDIEVMLVERLGLYQERNGVLPERIFVFRDGVSEGQFDIVLEEELKGIRKAFKNPKFQNPDGSAYRPLLSIIICGKRHHARMAPTNAQFKDKGGNTRPGTVIDKGITAVYDFDFYLQSHVAIQGHAKGTHYTVVYDENRFTADEIQQGIHNMCHLYARATRAVSLVPPAYYADLACERARFYLNEFFDAAVETASSIASGSKGKGKKRDKQEERESVFREAVKAWGEGLHDDIKNTMFYQ